MVAHLRAKLTIGLDIAVLTIVSLGLRIWGLGFDLPNLYHRDEGKYVSIPLTIMKTGDYNPHFFNYPTLFFYLLTLGYIVYFLLMASRGYLGSLQGLVLPEKVMENVVWRATMPSQFLVGRGIVALTGVFTVWVVYWLVGRAFGRRAALIAALALCVSPTHVRNSHFVAPDVTMILIVVLAFSAAYQVWREGRRRDYVVAGFLVGLAVSTKYNAYPAVLPLLVAHAMGRNPEHWFGTDIALAGLSCVAGFFLGTPYAFLDLAAFLNGLSFELRHYSVMADPGDAGQNSLFWYVSYLLRTEGLVPVIAAAAIVRGFITRNRAVLLFSSFPVFYLGLISFYVVKNDRTALTIVPFLAMLAGVALDTGLGWIGKQWERLGRSLTSLRVLCAGLILVALALPTVRAVQINRRFMQEDVRTQVTRWLHEHVEPGTRVVGEYYSPLLVNSDLEFRWIDYASDQPYEWYLAHADYVVLMENRYQGFFVNPSRYPEQVALYAQLRADSNLVKEFDGVGLGNAVRAQIYRVQQ